MSFIARLCCAVVRVAAIVPTPNLADKWLANATISVIGVYQRYLSARTKRICLFSPSCSHRAQGYFRELGFSLGSKEALAQLRRCGGRYSLSVTVQGNAWLTTADGLQFGPKEISPLIARQKSGIG